MVKVVVIAIGAVSGGLGLMMFISEPLAITLHRLLDIDSERTALLLLLIGTLSLALVYLQSGGSNATNNATTLRSEIEEQLNHSASRLATLEQQLAATDATIEKLRPTIELTAEERLSAIQNVVSQSNDIAIKAIFQEQTKGLRDELKKSLGLERLTSSSAPVVERLRREITDLRLRSNVNLLIGMSITAGGLYLLWSTVTMIDASVLLKTLASEGSESNAMFLKNLILPIVPRILLVVFVEIFAYFFLRLYRAGLTEIKYFQNELTNIESKLVAVEFSLLAQNQDALKSALESLSKTERNFILEKGQTTVELERAKSESELTRNVIKTIPDLFKQTKEK